MQAANNKPGEYLSCIYLTSSSYSFASALSRFVLYPYCLRPGFVACLETGQHIMLPAQCTPTTEQSDLHLALHWQLLGSSAPPAGVRAGHAILCYGTLQQLP